MENAGFLWPHTFYDGSWRKLRQPPKGMPQMIFPKVYWNDDAQPDGLTLDRVLYQVRFTDGMAGLLLDAVCIADILEDSDGEIALDALVSPFARLPRKMELLRVAMERVGATVKPSAVQITEPFKQRGVANVAAVFELSDGQTVSIFFHNPDVTPNKMAATDEVISWKWLLNKKDVTIVVAPERGVDLNVREVARRMMRLAEKNSAAFMRANVKRGERMAALEGLRSEIVTLTKELDTAKETLATLQDAAAEVTKAQHNQAQARSRSEAEAAFFVAKKFASTEAKYNAHIDNGDVVGTAGDYAILHMAGDDRVPEYFRLESPESAISAFRTKEDAIAWVAANAEPAPDSGNAEGDGDDTGEIAAVDSAYLFANATNDFKLWMHESLAKESYSPFVTAKAMDEAAKRNGATIEWGEFGSALDSVSTRNETFHYGFNKSLAGAMYNKPVKLRGYNGAVTIAGVHSGKDGAKVLAETAPDLTPADHKRLSAKHAAAANENEAEWAKVADKAAKRLWGREFAVSDYRVSGIGSSEFDDDTKGKLRELSKAKALHKTIAAAHKVAGTVKGGGSALDSAALDGVKERALYQAAIDADDDFQSELERVFGKENANSMRMQKKYDDPKLDAARKKKLALEESLRKAWKAGEVVDSAFEINFSNENDNMKSTITFDSSSAEQIEHAMKLLEMHKDALDITIDSALTDGVEIKEKQNVILNGKKATLFKAFKDNVMDGMYSVSGHNASDSKCLGAYKNRGSLDSADDIADQDDFDEEQEWEDMPDDDDALDSVALDGDFPGHPFRGNQHRKVSRQSGVAVSASVRAKKSEKSGDKRGAAKAHKSAYHAHAAAAEDDSLPKETAKYHKKMASFHKRKAGV